MSRWFRFYDAALDDPKVQRLPAEIFKTWVNLLCLASRGDGDLPPVEDIAFALRLSDEEARNRLDVLQKAGLLDASDASLRPHNWNARQFKSDVSSERVKRFRGRSKAVTSAVSETPPEAETDTDTETEKEEAAAAASSAAASRIGFDEIEDRLHGVTGWRLPGVRVIAALIEDGHSLADRILPLAKERAESRTRSGRPKPESWAWLATIVADPTCQPTPRGVQRPCEFVARDSPQFAELVARRPKIAATLTTHEGREGVWDYGALQ